MWQRDRGVEKGCELGLQAGAWDNPFPATDSAGQGPSPLDGVFGGTVMTPPTACSKQLVLNGYPTRHSDGAGQRDGNGDKIQPAPQGTLPPDRLGSEGCVGMSWADPEEDPFTQRNSLQEAPPLPPQQRRQQQHFQARKAALRAGGLLTTGHLYARYSSPGSLGAPR